MKKLFILIILNVFVQVATAQQANKILIIPKPDSVTLTGTGVFIINRHTKIVAQKAEAVKVAQLFNYFLQKQYGFSLNISRVACPDAIVLNVSPGAALTSEAYKLKANSNSINISGSRAGVFYGLQSLLQLINLDGKTLSVPAVTINDRPNFAYRGLMLDVGRHFFAVDEIKKLLDAMAYFKLNRFHWHLTDDQGWRLEIKKYPLLTTISAWRDSSIIGNYGDHKSFVYDGQKSGGFYTQEQARDIVKYAADRGIEVIPEIEMPGHSTAVLAAYPQLGNGAAQYQVPGYWGVHATIYNPGEPTFKFLEDVLTEVMAIFPSKYIHIGGDEVPKSEWKTSALAQSIIKNNHLKDENELQSWFISKIENFLNKNGRSLIGWDEILEGGLAANATVMSWRGEAGGIQAAKQGHHVIMSPGGNMYLDHAQGKDRDNEPLSIGGFLPLNTVYNYNPLPAALTPDEQKYVLGVQGNTWTEYIPTNNKLEYMLFPRAIAIAEVGWTKPENKNYEDFTTRRLPHALAAIEKLNINYRIPEAAIAIIQDNPTIKKKITITPFTANSKVYYTVDGHKADNTANLYTGTVTMPYISDGQPATLRYVIVTADNRTSNEFSVDIK
jgi:hexosaminidase